MYMALYLPLLKGKCYALHNTPQLFASWVAGALLLHFVFVLFSFLSHFETPSSRDPEVCFVPFFSFSLFDFEFQDSKTLNSSLSSASTLRDSGILKCPFIGLSRSPVFASWSPKILEFWNLGFSLPFVPCLWTLEPWSLEMVFCLFSRASGSRNPGIPSFSTFCLSNFRVSKSQTPRSFALKGLYGHSREV